jgi:hypothetical protein
MLALLLQRKKAWQVMSNRAKCNLRIPDATDLRLGILETIATLSDDATVSLPAMAD